MVWAELIKQQIQYLIYLKSLETNLKSVWEVFVAPAVQGYTFRILKRSKWKHSLAFLLGRERKFKEKKIMHLHVCQARERLREGKHLALKAFMGFVA